jgi:hypothetical protein
VARGGGGGGMKRREFVSYLAIDREEKGERGKSCAI